jgi:hypothetical protein
MPKGIYHVVLLLGQGRLQARSRADLSQPGRVEMAAIPERRAIHSGVWHMIEIPQEEQAAHRHRLQQRLKHPS